MYVHTWYSEMDTWTRLLIKAGGVSQQKPSSSKRNEYSCLRSIGCSTMADLQPQPQGPPLLHKQPMVKVSLQRLGTHCSLSPLLSSA